MPYPHFMVYDSEARLVPLNERPTDDLTYLSRHIEISVAVHDTLSEEIPYPSDFQMLPDEVKKQWKQWVNEVPVTGFNSGKYDLNMVKKYFVKNIACNKEGECNEECLL